MLGDPPMPPEEKEAAKEQTNGKKEEAKSDPKKDGKKQKAKPRPATQRPCFDTIGGGRQRV